MSPTTFNLPHDVCSQHNGENFGERCFGTFLPQIKMTNTNDGEVISSKISTGKKDTFSSQRVSGQGIIDSV